MALSLGRTGNNEYTRVYSDSWSHDEFVIVQYHRTDIVIVDCTNEKVIVRNGGYATISTTNHINRSIRRLSDEIGFVKYFRVGHTNGLLRVIGEYPPNVFVMNNMFYNKYVIR